MKHASALLALALLVACGPSDSPTTGLPTGTRWTEHPNGSATHFRRWQSPAGEALLVFGAEGDTLARLLVSTLEPPPQGPFVGPWTVIDPQQERIVLLSTTHTAYVAALGVLPRVVACAWPALQRDTGIREALAAGRALGLAEGDGARREQLSTLPEALAFHYPFGGEAAQLPQHHTAVPVCEYLEPHPLGRAEWLCFFGALTGTSARADSLYRAIADRYRALVRPADAEPPLVFLGSAWRGTWSVPSGNSLMARLVTDAGGRYRHAERIAPGNIDLPLETVMADAHACTHWGVVADVPGLRRRTQLPGVDQRLLDSPAFRNGIVFVANGAEADLFGRAMLEPEVLLADLRALLHPQERPGHRATYFRPLPHTTSH